MQVLDPFLPPRMRFSREQFDTMIAANVIGEDDRVELIDGEIYVQMAPGTKHIARVNRVQKKLERLIGDKAIVSTQNPIGLSEFSEPQPDIAVLQPSADFYEDWLAEPKDVFFIVEVSDTTLRFDREVKVPLYAACDIPEVWLLDVDGRQLTVFSQPEGNCYLRQASYGPDDRIPLSAFPGELVAAAELGL